MPQIYAEVTAPIRVRPQGGFFSHHGVWAPGVRLFRRLSFGWKAALVSLCFLVPLALVMGTWLREVHASISFSSQERDGVAMIQAMRELQPALIEQRRAALAASVRNSPPPPASPAVGEALRKAEAALQGHRFGTAAAFKTLQQAVGDAASAPATPEGQYQAHGAVLQAYTNLVLQVSDGSNLTLDPDVYTYYLMDAALFRLPRLIDEFDRKRATAIAMSSGTPTPAMQSELTRAAAVDELFFSDLSGSLTKSDGVEPGLLTALGLQKIDRLHTAYDEHVNALKDPAAIDASARELTAELQALQQQVLQRLDAGIETRIGVIEMRRAIVSTVLAIGLVSAG